MKFLIAGGGTGGHLYPGIALAEEVITRKQGNEAFFVGTERGIEKRVLPELGYELQLVDVAGLKGKGFLGLIQGLFRLPKAWFQSLAILKREQPDMVVGVGGYASGPVVLAAYYKGIPTAILEQNTVPGLTNRLLGRVVRQVFVMFEASRSFFPAAKVQALGNPIRRKLLDNFLVSKEPSNGRFNLLVLGGSQGAHAINEVMREVGERLVEHRDELSIVHQTGLKDLERLDQCYKDLGLQAEVKSFIEDMSAAYRRADLVICRAGATTLAELMVVKKACILIPYPFAADDHQRQNAESVVRAGAGLMMAESELTARWLAGEILRLKTHPEAREAMEHAAGEVGRPEAAREIVDACTQLIEEAKS